MSRRFSALSALLILAASLPAAAAVRVLAWDDEVAARELSLVTGNGTHVLDDLHPLQRSKDYPDPPEDGRLQVLAMDRIDDEGQPAVLTIRSTAGVRRPLVLLLPDPNAPSGLSSFVIEDDIASFAWGTMRFLNATGRELIFQWEQRATTLPATWRAVDVAPGGSERNLGIRVSLSENPAEALYSAVWEHNPDIRRVVIVTPSDDPRLGPIAFKILPEARPAQ